MGKEIGEREWSQSWETLGFRIQCRSWAYILAFLIKNGQFNEIEVKIFFLESILLWQGSLYKWFDWQINIIEVLFKNAETPFISLFLTLWVLSHSVVSNSLRPHGWSPPGSSVHGILQAKECYSGLPFPTAEGLPDPGIEPASPVPPALAGGFFTP